MLPPDNENYELDACSILCLQSNPPVLAVATLSGTLQHLALLQDSEVDFDLNLVISTVLMFTNRAVYARGQITEMYMVYP